MKSHSWKATRNITYGGNCVVSPQLRYIEKLSSPGVFSIPGLPVRVCFRGINKQQYRS